nr:hypothetical protein [Tanacetum cinerariifolium]
MILESIKNGPLIWPSIEENEVTRPKKYSKLSATEVIQADCDVKETNIILQGLPPEFYALVSNYKVAKELWERIQLLMQGTSLTKQERESVITSRYPTTNNQLRNSSNPREQATINDGIITLQPVQGRQISFALEALIELHNPDNVDTNMIYQAVLAMPSFEQSNVVNHLETEITSDSNIIPYSQYVIESQQEAVQNSNSSAQQDALILSNYVNSPEPTLSSRPTKVEVPKELPKVSMVNTSLKKLKHHLAGFDVVVKERTITTTITEGSWGFEHTKVCFRDKMIPFVKALKGLFNTFNQYLVDEWKRIRLKRNKSKQKRTKPDKNGKRVKAGKSLKQLQ